MAARNWRSAEGAARLGPALRRSLVLLAALLLALGPARAEPSAFAPFRWSADRPEVIALEGPITSGAALAFRRTLAAAPQARLLVLDSPGGDVDAGLLIADDVHARGLATLIPAGSLCASACAYVFLAGTERRAEGGLGVHQISAERPDLTRAQISIADIIDILNRFDTPTEVVTIMFRTPPEDLHVFTPEEVARYGIDRSPGPAPASTSAAMPTSPPSRAPEVSLDEPAPSSPPGPARKSAALSALDDYARQPTRMAVYAGLDFFGEDVGSASVPEASACAARCFELGGACKAFTFNTKTRPGRGPNCFLKAGRNAMDGNSAALSGEFLTRGEANAAPITLSVIDPYGDLYKNVDLPGLDLSRRPEPGATTEFACRRRCIADDRCAAFTFVRPKKECWLKSAIGTPRAMAGAVTGGKRVQTFTPNVITLD